MSLNGNTWLVQLGTVRTVGTVSSHQRRPNGLPYQKSRETLENMGRMFNKIVSGGGWPRKLPFRFPFLKSKDVFWYLKRDTRELILDTYIVSKISTTVESADLTSRMSITTFFLYGLLIYKRSLYQLLSWWQKNRFHWWITVDCIVSDDYPWKIPEISSLQNYLQWECCCWSIGIVLYVDTKCVTFFFGIWQTRL